MAALPRPQMRGLLNSHLKKHFVIGAALSVVGAAMVKYFGKKTLHRDSGDLTYEAV